MATGGVTFHISHQAMPVVQRGRTLYIYTASAEVARYNLDTGTSDRVSVRVSGLPSGSLTDWADPSLYVDEQGRLVLFMLYAPLVGSDPARCPSGVTSCTKQILSAPPRIKMCI